MNLRCFDLGFITRPGLANILSTCRSIFFSVALLKIWRQLVEYRGRERKNCKLSYVTSSIHKWLAAWRDVILNRHRPLNDRFLLLQFSPWSAAAVDAVKPRHRLSTFQWLCNWKRGMHHGNRQQSLQKSKYISLNNFLAGLVCCRNRRMLKTATSGRSVTVFDDGQRQRFFHSVVWISTAFFVESSRWSLVILIDQCNRVFIVRLLLLSCCRFAVSDLLSPIGRSRDDTGLLAWTATTRHLSMVTWRSQWLLNVSVSTIMRRWGELRVVDVSKHIWSRITGGSMTTLCGSLFVSTDLHCIGYLLICALIDW